MYKGITIAIFRITGKQPVIIELLYILRNIGDIIFAESFMNLIGIPDGPALFEDVKPLINLNTSVSAIGLKKKEFVAFTLINDVLENARSVVAEILLLKEFPTFTK